MSRSLPARANVDKSFTWNSESVFADKAAWEAGVATVLAGLPDLQEFKGHLGDSPDTLADWFDAAEKMQRLMARIVVYANMEYSCDAGDQEAAARSDRARSTAAQLSAAMSFALPEMIATGFPKLREWTASSPRLKHLGHYFERIDKLQRHVRIPEVEEILSQVTDPLATALSAHPVLANTDMTFTPAEGRDGPEEGAQGTIGALEDRWVDVYPNKGKRMGAFSTGSPDTPPFIFMSYNDDIYSMSTLAHELGHSMHSYFARRTQPFVYSNYGLFQAEVASNMHQALTRRHLLDTHKEPEFQIAVIEEAMSNFQRYFFIMPSLARFELEIHERAERGGALTAEYLNELMADLIGEVYGSEVDMSGPDRARAGSTWAQFHTHLYSNFYVYQYATGIAGAHHLANRVAAGEPGAVDSYREFLKSAGSMYPLDGLKMAGVDMSSPEPVQAAFATLADMVTRLETLTSAV